MEQRAAFLSASYGTQGERFRLNSEPSAPEPSAAALSWATGTWAIVTAWNPDGQHQPEADNLRAGRELLALIASRPHLPGVNGEGGWAESSVILPGLDLRQAAELGRRFGQAAVLFGVGQRVALVWLESDRVRDAHLLVLTARIRALLGRDRRRSGGPARIQHTVRAGCPAPHGLRPGHTGHSAELRKE